MATQRSTVDYILDQLAPLNVRARAMFGEYGVYCDEKFVAVVCDDTLFVKRTAPGAELAADVPLGSPYPGAKEHLAIPGERLDDREWLQRLLAATSAALPAPKAKRKPRAKRGN